MTIEKIYEFLPDIMSNQVKLISKLTVTDFNETKDTGKYICYVNIGTISYLSTPHLDVVKAKGEPDLISS